MDQDYWNGREDDIVISGMSGRFPKCENMREFEKNLFLKMDLITANDKLHWNLEQSETAQRLGIIDNIQKFDADFFNIATNEARLMDPSGRMLLEHAYEAIVDAGVNPHQLRNRRIPVITASSTAETGLFLAFNESPEFKGLQMIGGTKSLFAERISAWLNLTGPSFNIDTACSSSFYALEYAYRSIKNGDCEAALVAGANLCLHPHVTLQFSRLGLLSTDGKCKTFDEAANGYTRSETMAVAFLQKARDAKRVYATVVHAKTNCDGFKPQGITFPSSELQSVLLQEFYEECGVPTTSLSYVEAHGTGTKIGDPEEANAIDKVLSPGRKTPLKIGSIKSNLGHSEPASGMCAIGKIIIAMETGLIPPNLHFNKPRKDIEGLIKGRMKVVTEPTPWECDYAAASSFGFGGANGHILFKANPKKKVNNGLPEDDLPRLVCVSGRTVEAVDALLDDLESRPLDAEYAALFHNIHAYNISGHPYRGYSIVGPKGAVDPPMRNVQKYVRMKKQVWFVFSGIGSQWAGMGTDLLRFPVFAEALDKCSAALKPLGVNLHLILTTKGKEIFDNLVNTFVGIVAVQIGLVDLLSLIGIVPDKTIGYSIGELGRAYADGCLTAEQVILAAYHSALAVTKSKVIHGSMATVDLGYEILKDLCPPGIEIACRNGPKSCVLCGPTEAMKAFVTNLRTKNVSVENLPCCGVPLHSRYMAVAERKLSSYLQKTMNAPKPGTAASGENLSSVEYHVKNLLVPVSLEESISSIPKDAIIIEISPRGVLRSVLEGSVPRSVPVTTVSEKGSRDNVEVLLGSLGSLFTRGLQPQIQKLYPEIRFPVSRSTPMISPLIKWEHSRDWYVFNVHASTDYGTGERVFQVTLRNDSYNFMKGHVIDKRNLLPATGYLDLVWETYARVISKIHSDISVIFENVKFLRATNLLKDNVVKLTVSVLKGDGTFEISEGDTPLCTGRIHISSNPDEERIHFLEDDDIDETEVRTAKDVYKELRLRGYNYSDVFRSIESVSISGSNGHISWNNNWVGFLDNMLQMKLLQTDSRELFVPTEIEKVIIDSKKHHAYIRRIYSKEKLLPVRISRELDTIITEGVEIRGLRASVITRKRTADNPVLEEYKFVPHFGPIGLSLAQALQVAVNLALENSLQVKVKTIELVTEAEKSLLTPETLASPLISEILGNLPLIQKNVSVVAPPDSFQKESLPQDVLLALPKSLRAPKINALLAVGYDLLVRKSDQSPALNSLLEVTQPDGFILSRERTDLGSVSGLEKTLHVVLDLKVGQERLLLLRKKTKIPEKAVIVEVKNDEFTWIPKLQGILEEEKESHGTFRIYLVSEGNYESGLLGFANCLRRENGKSLLRTVLIQDPRAPKFSLEDPLFARQLEQDLAFNVLRPGGVWGSYRHLPLPAVKVQPVHHGVIYQLVRGDLHSLTWTEGPVKETTRDPRLTRIYYSSLNFRDVMLASGRLSIETTNHPRTLEYGHIGFEYSGIDASGRRIMGMVAHSGLSNYCFYDPDLSWEVPSDWTLEDAATVCVVYATCCMALHVFGKIKRGDKVLIHAGAGGIGQAAINLALHTGCEIFTTVGTEEKRIFIRKHFPQIPESHIGNSRDTSFEGMISLQTGGRGVDVVLNSLAEEKLQASVRCLARGGRFLEIGKFDIAANNTLDMALFQKDISFQSVMLDRIFLGSKELKDEMRNELMRCLDLRIIKPLVRKVFPKDQVEEAFRYMAAGKHIGKVLVKFRDEHEHLEKPILAQPRYHCLPERSYVIVGGLGGFGLELADWLVLRGARYLVLTSRNGITNGYQEQRVSVWQSYGVKLKILTIGDAWRRERCEEILREAADFAPVDGIFNLAVVLSDNLFENQSPATFEDSFRSKVGITEQLDALSRDLCPRLRHFVVFSSITSGRGNVGQTNYGMANSIMERICERRVAEGLHGLAIQWGAVGDVGLVADMQESNKEMVIGGTLQQRITSCLRVMDGFLRQCASPVVSSMVVAEKLSGGADNIIDAVLSIMGIKDLKSVNPEVSLAEMGMDSMSAVEIKQTLERDFDVSLTPQEIRALNFAKVIKLNNQHTNQERDVAVGAEDKDTESNLSMLINITNGSYSNPAACLKLQTQAEGNEGGRGDGREIVFIPGIDGYAHALGPLAPKIRDPAICLQLGNEHEGLESMDSMVEKLWLTMSENWKKQNDFVIVGYSFGSLLAIELVRKLEKEGSSGQLVLIDGCPEQFRCSIEQQIPNFSIPNVETVVLMGLLDVLVPEKCANLLEDFEQCNSWNEKLQMFFQNLPSTFAWDEDYKNLVTALYKRILAVNEYVKDTRAPLKSPVVFIKPSVASVHRSTENFGLDKVTEGEYTIYTVEGNHVTMLESDRVAAIINGDSLEDESLK